jgi:hypothetical protein
MGCVAIPQEMRGFIKIRVILKHRRADPQPVAPWVFRMALAKRWVPATMGTS